MARVAGVFDHAGDQAHARRLFSALAAQLGEPACEHAHGPVRCALYLDHEGERLLSPAGPPAASGFALGFGGDGRSQPRSARVPPWLDCRYEPNARAVTITTDPQGFALLYTRRIVGCTLFCSSPLALARVEPRAALDSRAVCELLAFDHLLGARSCAEGVELLPLGHALELDPRGARVERWFRHGDITLDRETDCTKLVPDLASTFERAMERALMQRRDGFEPIDVPLSGGLDSRLLAASAAALGAPIETFTFAGAHQTSAPDVAIARRVASALHVPWRFLPLSDDWMVAHAQRTLALTGGELDILHSAGVSVLDALFPGRIRLDGLWGGIELGGKAVHPSVLRVTTPRDRLGLLWRQRSRLEHESFRELLIDDALPEAEHHARSALSASLEEVSDDLGSSDPRWLNLWLLRNRCRRFTNHGASVWLARSRSVFVFFDPDFFERLFAIEPSVKYRGRLQAALFHHAFPAMAAIPWQRTGRPIPPPGIAGVLARMLPAQYARSQGFFDFDAMLVRDAPTQRFFQTRLLDPSLGVARFGCFDRLAVERLVSEAIAGRRRALPQLAILATLVLLADALEQAPVAQRGAAA